MVRLARGRGGFGTWARVELARAHTADITPLQTTPLPPLPLSRTYARGLSRAYRLQCRPLVLLRPEVEADEAAHGEVCGQQGIGREGAITMRASCARP